MRRRAALLAAALCFLSLPVRAAEAEKKPPPDVEKGDVLAEFPMLTDRGPILAPVTFKGKTYQFLVDTGASHTLFGPSFRSALGKHRRSVRISKPDGVKVFKVYDPPAAKVGALAFKRGNLVIYGDLRFQRELTGCDLGGVLGTDFLKDYILRLDFDRRKALLLRPGIRPAKGWGVPVRIAAGKCPYVTASVSGGGSGSFMVDTGLVGKGGLVLSRLMSAIRPGDPLSGTMGTASGRRTGLCGRAGLFVLAGYSQTGLLFMGYSDTNILGLEHLSRFNITLDFPRRTMYLAKSRRHAEMDRPDAYGLVLKSKDAKLVVKSVARGYPAEKAGFEVGDVILKLNGKPLAGRDMLRVRYALRSSIGRELSITVKRGERSWAIKTIPRGVLAPVKLPTLHEAVRKGAEEVAKLLAKGEKADRKDWAGTTALHVAAMLARTKVAGLLIAKGAEPNAIDKGGHTPLHYAAGGGHTEVLKLLLKSGAKADTKTKGGLTALHLAARGGQAQVIDALVDGGAPVDAKNPDGETPLTLAALHEHPEVVKRLLARGANVRTSDSAGKTPLHWAARVGNVKIAKLLRGAGADITARAGEFKATPLHDATGSREVVAFLLDAGLAVDVKASDDTTPLHMAAGFGHKAAAELLIAKGADVNAETDKGMRPLDYAREKEQEDLVKLLLKHGAKKRGLFDGR